MKSRAIPVTSEPVLKIHRYVVLIKFPHANGAIREKFHYCANRAEVRELKKKQRKTCVFMVFKAEHNFTGSWLIE